MKKVYLIGPRRQNGPDMDGSRFAFRKFLRILTISFTTFEGKSKGPDGIASCQVFLSTGTLLGQSRSHCKPFPAIFVCGIGTAIRNTFPFRRFPGPSWFWGIFGILGKSCPTWYFSFYAPVVFQHSTGALLLSFTKQRAVLGTAAFISIAPIALWPRIMGRPL
ncbi:hypothetical protein [Sphingobacterium sp.]|uniref:hypothetical protein n=1 Tax=Sphingobacterium sp. TaxID=341027 RepID=UPI0028B0ED71|nr:hypothetical protein [Sphingobacterium sp.]